VSLGSGTCLDSNFTHCQKRTKTVIAAFDKNRPKNDIAVWNYNSATFTCIQLSILALCEKFVNKTLQELIIFVQLLNLKCCLILIR